MNKKFHVFATYYFIFFIFIILVVCKKNEAPSQINDDKFVQIYCDVACYSDIVDKKLKSALVDSVLTAYNENQENFIFSKDEYSKDPKRWKKIFEKIVNELEKRNSDLEPEKAIKNNNSKIQVKDKR